MDHGPDQTTEVGRLDNGIGHYLQGKAIERISGPTWLKNENDGTEVETYILLKEVV